MKVMNIFVLDQYPLASEMIEMLIHRVHTKARVTAVHTFKQLNGLIDKYQETDADVDVVILEPQSTGCVGYLSVMHIVERLPNAKIIVMTGEDQDDVANRYLQTGAGHFISKKDKVSKITLTLQEILNPKSATPEEPTTNPHILKISKRHRQLINLLSQGYTNKQIAEKLGIAEQTVKVHFFRLYKMLGVNSRLQALSFAKTNGWLVDTA